MRHAPWPMPADRARCSIERLLKAAVMQMKPVAVATAICAYPGAGQSFSHIIQQSRSKCASGFTVDHGLLGNRQTQPSVCCL